MLSVERTNKIELKNIVERTNKTYIFIDIYRTKVRSFGRTSVRQPTQALLYILRAQSHFHSVVKKVKFKAITTTKTKKSNAQDDRR